MIATMKDIAQSLSVSVVTVSKVLRNHSDISAETRKRVLQRMKELNYHPNPAARALVTGRTNLIGLVVPDLLHPFFAKVAKAISARLRSQEYSLIIASSEDDPHLEKREIEQAAKYNQMPKVGFGSQIRNYFLHPDQRVKDARTGFLVGSFHSVLDGNLQGFLDAYLRWKVSQ